MTGATLSKRDSQATSRTSSSHLVLPAPNSRANVLTTKEVTTKCGLQIEDEIDAKAASIFTPLWRLLHDSRRDYVRAPIVSCPKCGTTGTHKIVPPFVRSTNETLINHLGGWLMLSLWQKGREQRFLCSSCDEFFYARTENSLVARAGFFVLLLMIAYAIYDWLAHL